MNRSLVDQAIGECCFRPGLGASSPTEKKPQGFPGIYLSVPYLYGAVFFPLFRA
jgi:hypothetical protein